MFVQSAYLLTSLKYLKEKIWLNKKENNGEGHNELIQKAFEQELNSIFLLKEYIFIQNNGQFKPVSDQSIILEDHLLKLIRKRNLKEQKSFVVESLTLMQILFLEEEALQTGQTQHLGHIGPDLYRTFDKLDTLFELNYDQDPRTGLQEETKERLYIGGGIGVQSGYSTVLLALSNLRPELNASIIDLGSGFGRVGLIFSLLRPDIKFTGYEYVEERVTNSNSASKSFEIQNNLKFFTQDLSDKEFILPVADIYYLYDPFTQETYDFILEQILALSKKQGIKVVTKGNARQQLIDIAKDNQWREPLLIDEGNLCIFQS